MYAIKGTVQGTSQSDLTTRLQQLQNAYSQDGGDLRFIDNNGNNTVHTLLTSSTFGGTKVERFNYLESNAGVWGSGTEYVFNRSYELVVSAEIFIPVGIVQWEETVRVIGNGGPRFTYLESLEGDPERQVLCLKTKQRAIQSGFGVADTFQPSAAAPIWPEYEHEDLRDISVFTPRFSSQGTGVNYGKRWRYYFTGSGEFSGNPTQAP